MNLYLMDGLRRTKSVPYFGPPCIFKRRMEYDCSEGAMRPRLGRVDITTRKPDELILLLLVLSKT